MHPFLRANARSALRYFQCQTKFVARKINEFCTENWDPPMLFGTRFALSKLGLQ
jgi:hypothetical protein